MFVAAVAVTGTTVLEREEGADRRPASRVGMLDTLDSLAVGLR